MDFLKPSTTAALAAAKTNALNKVTPPVPQAQSLIKGQKIQASELLAPILGKAVAGISTGINTKLSDGLFTSGAKDELIAADIYGEDNSSIINTFTDKLSGIGGLITGNKSSIVSDLLKMASSGGKIDLKSMTDRIVQEMGGSSGIISNLSSAVQGKLTGSFSVSSELFDKMKVSLGDITSGYRGGDLTSARGIFDLMGRFCGDSDLFKMVDLGAQTNLLSGLIDQAISYGVTEFIPKLLENSKDSRVTEISLENNIQSAVEQADLATINLIADTLGSARITTFAPTAVSTILARYKIPNGKKDTDYATLWAALKTTLDRLDPYWLEVQRGSELHYNLGSFTLASEDVKKIVVSDPVASLLVMVGKDYPKIDLMESAKKQYPLLAA